MRRSDGDAPKREERSRVIRLRDDSGDLVAQLARYGARDASLVDRARRLLAPLHDDDRKRGGDLAATLQVYYRRGCSVSETAEALFLHRNSVRYRLDRVRAMLELDVDAPETVAALVAAFALIAAAEGKALDATLRAQ